MKKLLVNIVILIAMLWSIPAMAEEKVAKGNADNGKKVFESNCVSCHGTDGKGKAFLKPQPTDFTNADVMSKKTDDEMFKVIKEGGKATGKSALMGAYGSRLKDEEIKDIVAYIRTFVKK